MTKCSLHLLWPALAALTAGSLASSAAIGASVEGRSGSKSLSVSYQYISVDGFESNIGELAIGTTDTHTWNFQFEYAPTDRLTLSFGLPLVRKRYQGPDPHRPDALVPPRDVEIIDDGEYHTDFQDLSFGFRYLWKTDPVVIEPFVRAGVPSNDYPFFAHAAVGQNLRQLEIGANFVYFPALSDLFFGLAVSRVFLEETLGTNIDNWRLNAQAGYYFTPRLSGRVFAMVKEGNGFEFPDDFPPPLTDERWFQHDRLLKHNYINVGAGFDWAISTRYQLSVSGLKMVHADNVHIVEYAVTLGLSAGF